MKKLILICAIAVFAITACKKENGVSDLLPLKFDICY